MTKRELDTIARGIDSYVMIPEETDFLLNHAQRAKQGIIEIGSWLGRSTLYLASVAKDVGIPMVCVDSWTDCDVPEQGGKDFWPAFLNNMKSAGFPVCRLETVDQDLGQEWQIVAIPKKSQDARPIFKQIFKGIRFDLLFIDADHSYEAVKYDYNSWGSVLDRPGVIIFHDICTHPGPRRLFTDLASNHDYKFARNIGAIYYG
jgi:predicted O-methyltransferase YrrM